MSPTLAIHRDLHGSMLGGFFTNTYVYITLVTTQKDYFKQNVCIKLDFSDALSAITAVRVFGQKTFIALSGIDKGATGRQERPDKLEEEIKNKIFEIIQAPFRKSDLHSEDNSFKLLWDSILMTRRLVLLFTKAFIMNTVVRLLVMLLITILFVVHHVKVQTFQSNILNYTETGLLLMLTVICVLNILPAYNYMYPFSFPSFLEAFLKSLQISK